jgi:predicted transposase YbfD/YdcC
LSGDLPLSKRTIRAEVKLLNSQSSRVGIKSVEAVKPPNPGSSPPKLPTGLPPSNQPVGGKVWSIEKWCHGERTRPRMIKELNYLGGSSSQNEKYKVALDALRPGHSGSGKVARIRALAAALHREFKSLSDRYQLEQEHDREFKRYMTVWQTHWKQEGQLDVHSELGLVRDDLNEVNRHFEISVMLSWVNDVKLVE